MKTTRTLLAAICCTLPLISPFAQASLVSNGDGSFTDTATGYHWRTLAQYDGLDFAAALALLPGGYHSASETELATLTAAAPALPGTFAADAATFGAADMEIIWGYYGDGTRYLWKASYDAAWNSNAANGAGWTSWNYTVGAGTAQAGLSLFAVNTAPVSQVPEPGTITMLGLGLCVLAWQGRGLRRKSSRRP